MSYELFQLMKGMNMKNLEIQVAMQCAPLLAGIKISNLLIVHNQNARAVIEMFQDSEISFFTLCVTEKKTTFLLYRKTELSMYMGSKEVKRLLELLGYENHSIDFILACLKMKYEKYMEDSRLFPHELGLILGYPVEDVHGFIVNKGQNFLMIGYWKVYEDVLEKQKVFEQYNEAKETMILLVSRGVSILEIIDKYSKSKLQKVAI